MYKLVIALRYIRRRLITLFSIMGIAIGVTVLIVVLSVMDGFRKEFTSRLQGTLSDIVISVHSSSDYKDIEKEILSVPNVKACSPHLWGLVLLGAQDRYAGGKVVGIDYDREKQVGKLGDYLVTAYRENQIRAEEIMERNIKSRHRCQLSWKVLNVEKVHVEGYVSTGTRVLCAEIRKYVPNQKNASSEISLVEFKAYTLKNNKIVLVEDNLSLEKVSSALFRAWDVQELLSRFSGPEDKLSQTLLKRFSPRVQEILQQTPEMYNPNFFSEELNQILIGKCIYDKDLFADIVLAPETRKLMEQNPVGLELIRLNRMLLEDAYPQDIVHYKSLSKEHVNLDELLGELEEEDSLSLSRYLVEHFSPSLDRIWRAYREIQKKYDKNPESSELLEQVEKRRRRVKQKLYYEIQNWIAGKVYLFSVNASYGDVLQDGNLPKGLCEAFERNGYRLSEKVIVSGKRGRWLIEDRKNTRKYLLKKMRKVLYVYTKGSLYRDGFFEDVELGERTRDLVKKSEKLNDADCLMLNSFLLQDAYPYSIKIKHNLRAISPWGKARLPQCQEYFDAMSKMFNKRDIAGYIGYFSPDLFRVALRKPSLMSIDIDYHKDLDAGIISDDLKELFEENDCPFTDTATLEIITPGEKWRISEPEQNKEYLIAKETDLIEEMEMLNVYGNLHLINADIQYAKELSAGIVSTDFREYLRGEKLPLSKNTVLAEEQNPKWSIHDRDRDNKYIVMGNKGIVRIYQIQKTDPLAFAVDIKYENDFNAGIISNELRKILDGSRLVLSRDIDVKVRSRWTIADKDADRVYFVTRKKDALSLFSVQEMMARDIDVDVKYKADLDAGIIPDELRKQLGLSANAKPKATESGWTIDDKNGNIRYYLRKDQDALKISRALETRPFDITFALKYGKQLDIGKISEELRNVFADNQLSLSANISIEKYPKWLLEDRRTKKNYVVEKQEGQLVFYSVMRRKYPLGSVKYDKALKPGPMPGDLLQILVSKLHLSRNLETVEQKDSRWLLEDKDSGKKYLLLTKNNALKIYLRAESQSPSQQGERYFLAESMSIDPVNPFEYKTQGAEMREMRPVIMGYELMRSLGIRRGDTIAMMTGKRIEGKKGEMQETLQAVSKKFVVVGGFKSGWQEIDKRLVYARIEDLDDFLDEKGDVNEICVSLENQRLAEKTKALLDEKLNPFSYKSKLYGVQRWEDTQKSLLAAIHMERNVMTIILFFIIALAVVTIMIILVLLVKEKTKDIGILKSMGASDTGIMSIFLLNGVCISIFGSLLGTGAGVWFSLKINWIADFIYELSGFRVFPRDVYYLDRIPIAISITNISLIIGITLILSLLGCTIPAFQAARMNVVDALSAESVSLKWRRRLKGKPSLARKVPDSFFGVNQLQRQYRSGESVLNVLNDVNLEIKQGEILVIVGSSGAGKSTLLHLMGMLDTPSQGMVFWKGLNLNRYSNREQAKVRCRNIGFIFQFYHLLPEFTALENVLLGAMIRYGTFEWIRHRKECIRQAKNLLCKVGLEKRTEHLPQELSGGERQRVAIARALVNDPQIVLCDEPTGNLDEENSQSVQKILWELNEQLHQTFIIVTHESSIAEKGHRVFKLKQGKLHQI